MKGGIVRVIWEPENGDTEESWLDNMTIHDYHAVVDQLEEQKYIKDMVGAYRAAQEARKTRCG